MILLLAALLVVAPAPVESPALPAVSFTFDRPPMTIPHYEIVIGQDGHGVYRAQTKDGVKLESAILVDEAASKKIWAKAAETKGFREVTCETKLKNLAQTGKKVLSWSDKSDSGSCTYNYSDDKEINAVTTIFQSLAQTMEYGQQLEHAHRFDRLGLDALMTSLATSVKEGRAIDPENIAPILKKIIADTSLMDRVRMKAENLLQKP